MEVLEALKLYLNIPRLVFVVGVDKMVVERLVIDRYSKLGLLREDEEHEAEIAQKRPRMGEDKARQYLAKMFQVEVELAPTEHQAKAFLAAQLETIPSWRKLSLENSQLFNDVVLKLVRGNPREIKRLLNSALIAAAGNEMRSADGKEDRTRFTEGLQDFCIRRILQKDYSGVAGMIDTDEGRRFLADWSRFILTLRDTRPGETESDLRKLIEHELSKTDEYRKYFGLLPSDGLYAL